MKLLVITAVKAFEKDIKSLLKKSKVSSFSYTSIAGAGQSADEPMEGNWFVHNRQEQDSVMFYVFVNKEYADAVFEGVMAFNDGQTTWSNIHVAMLNVEKSNFK